MIERNFKTYIIGLEDSFRGGILENQLSAIQVEFERVNGVVGTYQGLPVSAFADQSGVIRVLGRPLNEGEIGCALAHQTVYQRIIADDGTDWALVLEDDSRLVRAEQLKELTLNLDRFEKDIPTVICFYALTLLAGKRIFTLTDGLSVSELLITPSSTSAYLINKAAAIEFASKGLPLVSPADWPQRAEGKIRFLLAFPFIFEHDFEHSDSAIGDRLFPGKEKSRAFPSFRRIVSKITFLDWFRHRGTWGSFRSYWRSNVIRPITLALVGEKVALIVPSTGQPTQASTIVQGISRAIGGGCVRRG